MRPHPTAPAIGDTVTIVNTGPNHGRTGHTGIVVGGTLWTASIADHGDRVVEFPDGARLVYDAMFLRRITPTVTLLVEITVDGDASTYAGYVDPAKDLCEAVRFWAAFASPGGAPATVTVRPLPSL